MLKRRQTQHIMIKGEGIAPRQIYLIVGILHGYHRLHFLKFADLFFSYAKCQIS